MWRPSNRFKAAEADRMISEWTYWYGASDAQGLTEFEFYGKPWDNFAMSWMLLMPRANGFASSLVWRDS